MGVWCGVRVGEWYVRGGENGVGGLWWVGLQFFLEGGRGDKCWLVMKRRLVMKGRYCVCCMYGVFGEKYICGGKRFVKLYRIKEDIGFRLCICMFHSL